MYASKQFESVEKGWVEIRDIYRSPRINKNAGITIDIMNGNDIFDVKQRPVPEFVMNFHLKPSSEADVLYYATWVDEYTNDNYLKRLTPSGSVEVKMKKADQPCSIDVAALNEHINSKLN